MTTITAPNLLKKRHTLNTIEITMTFTIVPELEVQVSEA